MARSPLFHSLRRAFRAASIAARQRPGRPPLGRLSAGLSDDDLVERLLTRRSFIGTSAAAAAGVVVTGCDATQPASTSGSGAAAPATPPPGGAPRIAIVGAGMAGLNAAYKLKQGGHIATVYEGANRTGGRMFTVSNLLGEGLTTELGGEFIDSGHEEMLKLMTEFGLEKLDTRSPEAEKFIGETYFINGRHYTTAQAAKAFVPIAKRIQEDYDALGEVVDYQTEGGGTKLDRMSIAQYFDSIGVTGWMRELMDVAYVTEYGLDSNEQSALNFVFLIGTGDLSDASAFSLLGESDERYKVRGGNQRVCDELAKRLEGQVKTLHRLEAIKSRGTGFTLTFQHDGKAVQQDADIVVCTLPFTVLRDVKIDVEMPDLKKKAIRELGYGANAKVLIGFKSRPWEKLGYSGAIYSDEPFQLAWANSFLQSGTAGGLTLYSGGRLAREAGNGAAEAAAARLLPGIDKAFKGASTERNGKYSRMHWPSFPWTKAAYACYKPGQWTTIAGAEGLPVGNLFFAGEHCSYDFQGYMNGAAQTGADVAKAVLAAVTGAARPS